MSNTLEEEITRVAEIKKEMKLRDVKTITPRNMFEQYLQIPEEYSDKEDLLSKEWIIQRTKSLGDDFYQYSVAGRNLMAEFSDGRKWWVIGFLSHDESENFPKWQPVK